MQPVNNNGINAKTNANDIIHSFDWSSTPLGDAGLWPENLVQAVNEKLNIKSPKNDNEETRVRLQLANEAAQLGTFDWDLVNEIFLQSPRVTEIFGFSDHLNTTHKQFINSFHPEDLPTRNKAVEESFKTGSLVYEARVIWPDKTVHWVKIYGKVLYGSGRRPQRMYGTVQDITREKNMLKLLEEEEYRSRIAIEAAQLATFDWSVETNTVVHSARLPEIFGFFNGRKMSREDMIINIHPDDRKLRDAAVEVCMQTDSLYYEVRIVWPDSTIHAIKVHGRLMRTEQGKPAKIYGIVQDITKEQEVVRSLADNQDRLRIALDSAELGTWDLHLNPVAIFYSPRLAKIFGYNEFKQLTHQQLRHHVHPEDMGTVFNAHEVALTTGILSYEVRIIWKDGSIHWIRARGKCLYDSQNKPYRVLGIIADITAQKAAIKELEESEQRLRLATQSAALGTFDIDLATGRVICSPRYFQIFGYPQPQPWERDSFYSHLHPGDIPLAKKVMTDALTTGNLNYIARVIWKDGGIHWIKKNGIISYNSNGTPARLIGTIMDITEERNAITAMKESELMFNIISGTAPVGLWLTDTEGSCVFVNRTWIEWTGLSFEENMGGGWFSNVPEEDIPATHGKFTDALINRKYFNAEFRVRKAGEPDRWCLTEGYPFYGIDGAFAGFAGSVTDITDRKLIEEQLEQKVRERTADLKRSEERNHKMVNEIQDYAILLLDKEGFIQNWNKGAEKIKGYKESEIKGKNFRVFYTREDQERKVPERLINTAIKEGRASAEGWRVRKDGTRFWANIVITALHDDQDNIIGFSKITRDLTERKITEEQRHQHTRELSIKNYELQKQKEFVDVILDSSVDVVSVFDTEMRYISVNKKLEEVYGVTKEEILGKKVIEAFPETKTTVFRENLEKALNGQYIHGFLHKSPITGRHYESFFIPLKNNGEVYAVLAVAHDNTEILESAQKLEAANRVLEEKTEDLERANAALEKSNSELEQYAYVASHDLQEPLRKIRTYSGILSDSLKGKADTASLATLEKVIKSATRMSNLIYDLLNFSRLLNPEKQFAPTDLNKIFQDIISDFELVIQQKQATITVDALPLIDAVPLQMNQLFYNLVNNALKFSRENVPPVVTITAEMVTRGKIGRDNNADRSIECVEITITDNGIGFSQQYAEQIFEVFKRLHTKQAYQGSGIGLALCRRIVLNHQGDIYAEGKENGGSVFHVILPVKQPKNNYDGNAHGSFN